MSDKSSSSQGVWSDTWLDMQKKYWDAFSQLSRQVSAASPEKAPEFKPDSWAQGVEFWSRLMAPAMPAESRSWVEKTLELNRSYQHLGESLWKAMSQGAEAAKGSSEWWDLFTQSLGKMQSGAKDFGGAGDPWAGFATFWGMPLDNWRRVASACSTLPGDMEKALHGGAGTHGAEGLSGLMGGWLSTPTLGYTREWQGEQQRLGQLWLDHGLAVQAYNKVLARVVEKSAELLRAKLFEPVETGAGVESLRSFYNTWVDCGEEAYAEVSSSDEFTSAQAKLTNTLMAVKRQEQKMVDELLGAMNMPTRRELDTSHRRLHQLQRQVWRMAESLEDAGVRELREEVSVLRREVEELRRVARPEAPDPAAPRRRSNTKSSS